MKVLLVESFLEEKEVTGISVHVSNIIKRMYQQIEVIVMTLLPTDDSVTSNNRKYTKDGITYIELSNSIVINNGMKGLSKGPVSWWILANLSVVENWDFILDYIKKEEISVVHLQDCFVASLIELCKEIRKPIISTIHALNPDHGHFGEAMRKYDLYNSDRVITVSNWMREEILRRYPLMDRKDIAVVYNGIEDISIKEKSRKYITYAGRLVKLKGVDILLKAYANLVNSVESLPQLVIMGDGPEKNNLCELANKLGIKTMVRFTGEIKQYEVREILAESIIHVVPSRTEALGLSALEGMIQGSIVIASNIEGLSEVIEDQMDGFLFEKENYVELSEVMRNILENKEFQGEITGRAKEKVRTNFSWDKAVELTIDIYRKMIEGEEYD